MFFLLVFVIAAVGVGLLALVVVGKLPLNAYPVLMMPSLFLIFVVNALQLHSNAIAYNYINESMFVLCALVCLVSFLSVIAGWCYFDVRPGSKNHHKKPSNIFYSYDRLFIIGTLCHIISFGAELAIASNRGGLVALYSVANNFYTARDNPIFSYLFLLTFVGTVPYLQCLLCNKHLPQKQRIVILAVCLIQILRAIIVGRRAWIFNILLIYLTIPFFCTGRRPKFRQVAYFVIPAAIFVLILPAIRNNIYLGSQNLEKVPELAVQALVRVQRGDAGSGIYDSNEPNRVSSEFILGAAIISAAFEKNAYTYGLSFYDFMINPIPRALWPEKPKNIGLQSQVDIVNQNFRWEFNPGSAPTGIADVFLNFGFFCIPFWFFFGLLHRRVYNAALVKENFYAQGLYICLLWGSIFLLNQSVLLWGTTMINSVFFMTLFYAYARMVKPQPRLTLLAQHDEDPTH